MTDDERRAALEAIAAEVRVCRACRLHTGRTNAVPGEGHPDTEVMFVGEGPGFNEDQQGRPFCGAAGQLLTELLTSIGWRRDEVFITNVVKCRPPGNRDPEPDEIAACAPYLRRQLEALDPAVIVTLGRFSLGTFMPGARISGAHGTSRPVDPATGASSAVAYAMYHPAAAFRQTALKETLFAEVANLPQVLIDARAARAARVEPAATGPLAAAAEPMTLDVLTGDRPGGAEDHARPPREAALAAEAEPEELPDEMPEELPDEPLPDEYVPEPPPEAEPPEEPVTLPGREPVVPPDEERREPATSRIPRAAAGTASAAGPDAASRAGAPDGATRPLPTHPTSPPGPVGPGSRPAEEPPTIPTSIPQPLESGAALDEPSPGQLSLF